jgi:predicted Zn-dependent protease
MLIERGYKYKSIGHRLSVIAKNNRLTPLLKTAYYLDEFPNYSCGEKRMAEGRIELFKKMLHDNPKNSTIRFGLANELFKLSRFEEAAAELRTYLDEADDQGAAYGKLAQSLERLGLIDEARAAYQQGIAAANRHGHPGMAQEFEMALEDL